MHVASMCGDRHGVHGCAYATWLCIAVRPAPDMAPACGMRGRSQPRLAAACASHRARARGSFRAARAAPHGARGGGRAGTSPALVFSCVLRLDDSRTRLAFHFLFHFFSKTLITRLPSPSPQSISNKKSLSGWRGRRQTTQSQAAERLSVAVRISARRSCCRGGR